MSEPNNRARNRAAMPIISGVVDAFRAAFGPGVVVLYAREGGLELGEPGPAGTVPIIVPIIAAKNQKFRKSMS